MKSILSALAIFTIKDWFIIAALFILFLCILEIRKLKRIIAQEIQKRLIPQLNCELVVDADINKTGLFLKNESFFLAKDIKIEDIFLSLDDFGYNVNLILKLEGIDSLRSQEKAKLNLKVFDRNQNFESELTEKIFPHLTNASFRVEILYSNIEGLKFQATLSKKKDKFYTEKIETLS